MTLQTGVAQTAIDFAGLNSLRFNANQDQNHPETLRQVSAQFESLFISMMLKSMRDASMGDPLFESQHSEMYREYADQQLAIDLANRGGLGLQDVIIRQLGGDSLAAQHMTPDNPFLPADTITTRAALPKLVERVRELSSDTETSAADIQSTTLPSTFRTPAAFVKAVWPMAERAAAKIGTQPEVLVAQAALETGWGRYVLGDDQGSSYNLFNIKAGQQWSGDTLQRTVLEFHQGVPIREASQFRAYSDYQHSFDDYVQFLQTNPRYRQALAHAGDANRFVEALQQAGYATDPAYADKIKRIMQGETLAQNSQGGF